MLKNEPTLEYGSNEQLVSSETNETKESFLDIPGIPSRPQSAPSTPVSAMIDKGGQKILEDERRPASAINYTQHVARTSTIDKSPRRSRLLWFVNYDRRRRGQPEIGIVEIAPKTVNFTEDISDAIKKPVHEKGYDARLKEEDEAVFTIQTVEKAQFNRSGLQSSDCQL